MEVGPAALHLLVTRPEPQASAWAAALQEAGCRATALPLLGIAPHVDFATAQALWQTLGEGDMLMFVSPAAVSSFFQAWPALPERAAGLRAAVTGPGSAQALQALGWPGDAIVAPPAEATQLDSEALWECLKGEAWAGRKVCIVRGEGGRDWLATQLAQAGAELSFLEAYRRCDPEWRADQWAVARSAAASPESAVWLLSSSESLGPLHRLLPGRDWSTARAWASHPRIGAAAEAFGFGQVLLLQPGLPAVVEAVLGAMGANSTIAPTW